MVYILVYLKKEMANVDTIPCKMASKYIYKIFLEQKHFCILSGNDDQKNMSCRKKRNV